METKATNKERNGYIEALRYAATCLIVLLHFTSPTEVVSLYGACYLAVEFFFILSGFMMYRHYDTNREKEQQISPFKAATNYTWARIKSIAPAYYLAFAILFISTNVINLKLSFYEIGKKLFGSIWELLFLNSTGVTLEIVNFPTWYISALVIVGYFLYYILRRNENFFIGLVCPFFVVMIYQYYAVLGSGIDVHLWYDGFSTGATNRAVAGLCLGCILWKVYIQFSKIKFSKFGLMVLNIIEVVTLYLCAQTLFNQPHSTNNLKVLVFFPILILTAYSKKTILFKVFNQRIFTYLGRLSLMIYLNHSVIIYFFRRLNLGTHNIAIDSITILFFCTICSIPLQYITKLISKVITSTTKKLVEN